MKIKRIISGQLESNCYFVYDEKETMEGYIIDPGYNHKKYIEEAEKLGINVKGILLTHHHYDHSTAAKQVAKHFQCPIYIHLLDGDLYDEKAIYINEGDLFTFGGETIETIHTPGHTEGSVCFWVKDRKTVFTGDTIFNVDLGRTDLSDGDPKKMVDSIKNKINKWENDIFIYPGHGDSCNMKYVRNKNYEFLDIVNN